METGELGKKFVEEPAEVLADQFPKLSLPQGVVDRDEGRRRGRGGDDRSRWV